MIEFKNHPWVCLLGFFPPVWITGIVVALVLAAISHVLGVVIGSIFMDIGGGLEAEDWAKIPIWPLALYRHYRNEKRHAAWWSQKS